MSDSNLETFRCIAIIVDLDYSVVVANSVATMQDVSDSSGSNNAIYTSTSLFGTLKEKTNVGKTQYTYLDQDMSDFSVVSPYCEKPAILLIDENVTKGLLCLELVDTGPSKTQQFFAKHLANLIYRSTSNTADEIITTDYNIWPYTNCLDRNAYPSYQAPSISGLYGS